MLNICQDSCVEAESKSFNQRLRMFINKYNYCEITKLISNNRLLSIEDETYRLLFINSHPLSSHFINMLSRDDIPEDTLCFFLKRVPFSILTKEGCHTKNIISLIFRAYINLVPKFLRLLSQSERCDIVFDGSCMEFLKQKQQEAECNRDLDTKTCHPSIYLQYYSDAINAMEKYCSQDTDGKFRIEPYYLCINDALDEIQTNLNQIKETFDKRRNVNTNDITHGYLVKKAKLNEEIDFSICSDLPELTLEGCIAGPSITEANSKI